MTNQNTRNFKSILLARRELVIYSFKQTRDGTPEDTVNYLVNLVGLDNAKICIAECINSTGEWDKRIYGEVREWASNVPKATSHIGLESYQIYDMSSWIHSSHLNQIGLAIMKKEGLYE